DVAPAGVFVVDAPGLPGIATIPLSVTGVVQATWAQWHAGVIVLTTGTAVGLDGIAFPPIPTRQRIVNNATVDAVIVVVDDTNTPIGTGPTIVAGTAVDIIFDGANVIAL